MSVSPKSARAMVMLVQLVVQYSLYATTGTETNVLVDHRICQCASTSFSLRRPCSLHLRSSAPTKADVSLVQLFSRPCATGARRLFDGRVDLSHACACTHARTCSLHPDVLFVSWYSLKWLCIFSGMKIHRFVEFLLVA